MTYNIKIELNIEDLIDLNMHMQLAKEQIKTSIKSNPSNPVSGMRHEGMGTSHEITISVDNEE